MTVVSGVLPIVVLSVANRAAPEGCGKEDKEDLGVSNVVGGGSKDEDMVIVCPNEDKVGI